MLNRKINTKKENINSLKAKLFVVDRLRDFDYILNSLNELEIIKNLLLNENQILCLEYLKKPTVNDYLSYSGSSLKSYPHFFNFDEENKEILCNYFLNLLKEDPLTGYDEFLFMRLDDDIKKKIERKLNIKPNHT